MTMRRPTTELRPELENIVFVLVHPQTPGNIGSAARAMKNMGLRNLRLVHPPLDRGGEAYNMAHGARDVLKEAQVFFDLDEALADCQMVIATTARLGGWRFPPQNPRQAAPEILALAENSRIAILFGAEDRGLTNDQVMYAQRFLTIPTGSEMTSLNLSQAVLAIAYELFCGKPDPGPAKRPALADQPQVHAMLDDLRDALQRIDFIRPGNPDYWMAAFRRMFGRTGLEAREVNLYRGIARQIRWMHEKNRQLLEKLGENSKDSAEPSDRQENR